QAGLAKGDASLKAWWTSNLVEHQVVCLFEDLAGGYSDETHANYGPHTVKLISTATRFFPHSYEGFVPEVSEVTLATADRTPEGYIIVKYKRASYPLYFNDGASTMYGMEVKYGQPLADVLVGALYADPLAYMAANSIPAPGAVTLLGLEFDKWMDSNTGGSEFNVGQDMPAAAVVLYASWKAPKPSVAFDYNDPTPAGASAPIVFKDEWPAWTTLDAGELDAFFAANGDVQTMYPGYAFLGWFANASDALPVNLATYKIPSGGVTFTARWAKADTTYTIEYRLEGTTGADGLIYSETLDGAIGTTISATALYFQHAPHQDYMGYLPTEYIKTLTLGADAAANVVVFEYRMADRSYIVRYVLDDAAATPLAPDKGPIPTGLYVVTENYLPIPGYAPRDYQLTQNLTAGTVLTFVYSALPPDTFQVTYDPGYAGGPAPEPGIGSPHPVGTDVTVEPNRFTRTGYTFDGWLLTGGGKYEPGDELLDVQNDLYFTAQWTRTRIGVTYRPGFANGPAPVVNPDGTYAVPATVPVKDNMFSRPGYTFVGWQLSGGGMYDPGDTVRNVRRNLVFTAQWELAPGNFIVTYQAGYAGGAADVVFGPYGAPSNVTVEANMFTRPGYTFTGWLLTSGGIYGPGVTLENISSDLVFVAQWIPDTFMVTYQAGYAGGAADVVFGPTDAPDDVTVAANMFTREGYTFTGWVMGGADYTPGDVIADNSDDLVFVAQWEEVPEEEEEDEPEEEEEEEDPPAPTPVVIDDEDTPLPSPDGPAWALLNLLASVLCTLFAILLLVGLFTRNRKKQYDEEEPEPDTEVDDGRNKRSGMLFRILAIIAGLVAPILFLLFEDVRLPMVFTDVWTIPTLIALVAQVIFMLLLHQARRKEDRTDDEGEAPNA
ncbi:MAG: InlB B-repeat-containing protein, partial [Oscillospiraceae bacterium]